MKIKTRLVTILFLCLTIFTVLACQLVSPNVPTPTVTPTWTFIPASTPTKTPTLTPTPKSDISSAVLTLDDLPPGFEKFTLEELGISRADFSDENFQPEEVFIFVNSQNFQMIFGFNFLLTDKFDRVAFDTGLSQPELTLPAFVSGMGSENVQDEKLLDGLEEIGELQIGMTMVAIMEGVPVQVDILMFRRNIIGAMVMSMVLEGQSPNITIHALGLKLDQNIQENLDNLQ
jgi:hypothetical protein